MNALLASYDSESGGSEEETVDALPKQKKEKSFALPEGGDFFSNPGAVEDSSDDDSEDNEDDDDADDRRRAAPAAPSFLPSVTDLFSEVTGPPEFLRPEATKPIAVNRQHIKLMKAPPMEHPLLRAQDAGAGSGGALAGRAFLLHRAVIGSSARLYSQEEIELKAAAAAAERAREAEAAGAGTEPGEGAAGPGARRPGEERSSGAPSRAMAVAEVFANPNMLLPRKRGQDRKNKEQEKRSKGQSAIGSWKSEAEMVLRQQYDS